MRAPIGAHLVRPDTRIVERPGWYQVVTPSARDGTLNEVVESSLSADDDVHAIVDRTIAEYAALGLPFRWVVDPASTRDLGDVLVARGFREWGARAMTADPRVDTIEEVRGVRVVEVRDTRALEDFCRVVAVGWELDYHAELERFRAVLSSTGRHRPTFVAYVDGEAVGAAGSVEHPRSHYLVGAVVLPALRGRGVYRALVRARLRCAAARGGTLVTTQAREATSAPVLERLGFETACRFRMLATPTR